MIATKTARTLQVSASNPAGVATTGTALSLGTALGGLATLVVTNGATAPTTGCDAILEASRDGANWHEFSRQTAGKAIGEVGVFQVEVPQAVMFLRSRFAGNAGAAVTVEAYFQELTAIG